MEAKDFLNWYWDYGVAASIFLGTSIGYLCGHVNTKRDYEKKARAEKLRVAITNNIKD